MGKNKKQTIILFCVAGGVLLLWLAFWGVVQPVIAKLYLEPDCYEGIHYVQDNSYLEFDGGKEFMEVLQKYGAFELGEVTEFFYFDNRRSDSPIYGKRCDIFAISISVQSDAQYQEKKEALIKGASGPRHSSTFLYYYTLGTDIPGVAFAFQDSTHTIRFIYVTDAKPYDPLLSGIAQNSPLFDYD